MEYKKLSTLLNNEKKLISILDCKGNLVCSGYPSKLIQNLGSLIYNCRVLATKEYTNEIIVSVGLELKRRKNGGNLNE